MRKRCVVFLETQYIRLFEDIINYSVVDLELVGLYGIALDEKELFGFAVNDPGNIMDAPDFEIAILLTREIEKNQRVIELVSVGKKIEIITTNSGTSDLFDAAGKMIWLKHLVEITYPRSLTEYVSIGDFTYYNELKVKKEPCVLEAKLSIGKFCSIGPQNTVLLGEEHHADWNTTYPFKEIGFRDFDIGGSDAFSKGDVVIGNDVWTGHGVYILSGVVIGDGAVIGAGAVVAKNVDPYSIVVGNPARVVKRRFSDEHISKLLEMKWWDWKYEHIYNAQKFLQCSDIDSLYEYYENTVKKN